MISPEMVTLALVSFSVGVTVGVWVTVFYASKVYGGRMHDLAMYAAELLKRREPEI